MCEGGDRTMVEVTVDPSVAFEGVEIRKPMPIDTCLVSVVKALDEGGIRMLSTCCGHGKHDGHIWLKDGRKLVIPKNNSYSQKEDEQ